MSKRWQVRKVEGIYFDENDKVRMGQRWQVISPTGVSWGKYATHAEAMTYADREAHTIAVTLPKPVKNSSAVTPVWWKNDTLRVTVYPNGEIVMMVDWDEEASYTAKTAREQALALLAAANYAEKNPIN